MIQFNRQWFSFFLIQGLLISIFPFSSQADIVQKRCIKNISEILNDIPENIQDRQRSIAIFDWDNTISEWDPELKLAPREFKEREPGNYGTLATIKTLQEKSIKSMILTGRLGGYRLEDKGRDTGTTLGDVELHAKYMLQLLGAENWMHQGPFKNTATMEMEIPGAYSETSIKQNWEVKRTLYLTAKDHIVFAGGNVVKGKAMQQLIAGDIFSNTIQNLFFIDDDEEYVNEMEESFKNSPQNVYLYYYPSKKENCLK